MSPEERLSTNLRNDIREWRAKVLFRYAKKYNRDQDPLLILDTPRLLDVKAHREAGFLGPISIVERNSQTANLIETKISNNTDISLIRGNLENLRVKKLPNFGVINADTENLPESAYDISEKLSLIVKTQIKPVVISVNLISGLNYRNPLENASELRYHIERVFDKWRANATVSPTFMRTQLRRRMLKTSVFTSSALLINGFLKNKVSLDNICLLSYPCTDQKHGRMDLAIFTASPSSNPKGTFVDPSLLEGISIKINHKTTSLFKGLGLCKVPDCGKEAFANRKGFGALCPGHLGRLAQGVDPFKGPPLRYWSPRYPGKLRKRRDVTTAYRGRDPNTLSEEITELKSTIKMLSDSILNLSKSLSE